MAAHPIRGALMIGVAWGAFMGAFMSFSTHDPVTTAVPFWIVGGLVLFGPITVWIDRAAIRRWDAAHPEAGTAFG